MSVVVFAGAAWIVLSVALAVFLGRTVRLADAHERDVHVPLPIELFPEDAATRFVDPWAGSRRR